MGTDCTAARYKLRQAEILLAHLRALPEQIARDLRRASSAMDHKLLLATYFFGCLGAARSIFYILSESAGRAFKQAETDWRNNALDQASRTFFHRMTNLRDRDVHYGEVNAEALGRMIPIADGSLTVFVNAAPLGTTSEAEYVNPDGSVSRAAGLQGSAGLYIEVDGKKVEAADACARYLDQLCTLIAVLEGAASTGSP
jgi:hypothetical protein